MQRTPSHKITDFSPHLFWDVDAGTLNPERNRKLIVERVIQRGSRADLQKLLSLYSKPEIADVLKQVTWLNEKDMAFVHVFFDIPYSELKCYSKRPFSRYY